MSGKVFATVFFYQQMYSWCAPMSEKLSVAFSGSQVVSCSCGRDLGLCPPNFNLQGISIDYSDCVNSIIKIYVRRYSKSFSILCDKMIHGHDKQDVQLITSDVR